MKSYTVTRLRCWKHTCFYASTRYPIKWWGWATIALPQVDHQRIIWIQNWQTTIECNWLVIETQLVYYWHSLQRTSWNWLPIVGKKPAPWLLRATILVCRCLLRLCITCGMSEAQTYIVACMYTNCNEKNDKHLTSFLILFGMSIVIVPNFVPAILATWFCFLRSLLIWRSLGWVQEVLYWPRRVQQLQPPPQRHQALVGLCLAVKCHRFGCLMLFACIKCTWLIMIMNHDHESWL